jgi:hypothetical protein
LALPHPEQRPAWQVPPLLPQAVASATHVLL